MLERTKVSVPKTVKVPIELFGLPRLMLGTRDISVELPEHATVQDLVVALAAAYPALVGRVISKDGATLLSGYIVNRNGESFLEANANISLKPGETLLILSNMAGG